MKRFLAIGLICISAACTYIPETNDLVSIQIQDRNGVSETISNPDRLVNFSQTDFLSSQPYERVVRLYKNEGKSQSVITTYHPNGLPHQYLEAQDQRAFGKYKEWFSNGQLKIEAQVIGGSADVSLGAQQSWLFDGASQVWDEQGNPIAYIPYSKGALEGVSTYFYPSGQIEKELPYSQNTLQGEKKTYWPNGRLRALSVHLSGKKEGLSLGYWQDETPAWIEDYQDGFLQRGIYYNRQGEEISDIHNGNGLQAVFDSETLHQLIEYKNGCPQGEVKTFTGDGKLKTLWHQKNGKKQGTELEYFIAQDLTERLAPKISIEWDSDQIHGMVKTWYENGKMQSQREWAHNKKNGAACSWYKDGSLMLIEEYEDERLLKGQYYKRGHQLPISTIEDGNGVATLHDDDGIFLRKVSYLKGKPIEPEN